jgi:hypothetical protein
MKLNQKSLSRSLCMRGFCRVLSGLVLIVVFHLSTSDVSAQTLVRSWVNPSVCNTGLGAVGTPTTPFPTIAAAIGATRAAVLTLQSSGTSAVGLVTAGPFLWAIRC